MKSVLSDACSHIDIKFHAMYERASRHAQTYNLAPPTPQRCVRQAGRDNHPGSTQEYYRRPLAIRFLDHLQNEITHKFTSHTLKAMRCLGLVPSCFTSENQPCDEEMMELFNNHSVFPSAAGDEFELLHSHFVGKDLPGCCYFPEC